MYVGLKMIRDVVTVSPKSLVTEADKLMEKHRLWMLLVVEGERLIGYVRKEDVREALPSATTTLSRHELNYLLSKLTVERLLRKDVPIVTPETEIEVAADLMNRDDLQGLAVVDSKGHLVGYINRNVMLDVLVEEMGLRQGGSRIVFEVEDRTGVIHEVSGIIAKHKVSIISTSTFFHENRRMVVIRVQTDDPSQIAVDLHNVGYKLVRAEDFVEEWLR